MTTHPVYSVHTSAITFRVLVTNNGGSLCEMITVETAIEPAMWPAIGPLNLRSRSSMPRLVLTAGKSAIRLSRTLT